MGSYESVCNDTNTPVVVWWQLLGGGPVLDAAATACLVVVSAIVAGVLILAALAAGGRSNGSHVSSSRYNGYYPSYWFWSSSSSNDDHSEMKNYMGSGRSYAMLHPNQCTPWKKLTLSLVHQVCVQEEPPGPTLPRPICKKMWSPSLANHYSNLKVRDITGQGEMRNHFANSHLKLHENINSCAVMADVCALTFVMTALIGFHKFRTGQKLLKAAHALQQEPLLHL
eukprot:gnl/MRDRNA2_/MRDRNA2_102142_c0_seq1.p1 gnl/MRDRNA2_/MRDRNA2_102142_c0~~gnl/MRDRNA2_/MRDRNA2_102142_c0_seq1.p1  ORF type:complete len:261 (-),score=29.80 gnl/MRDRNA2_/MRDRNA2_102142_c0_seq1:506-1183(-)